MSIDALTELREAWQEFANTNGSISHAIFCDISMGGPDCTCAADRLALAVVDVLETTEGKP